MKSKPYKLPKHEKSSRINETADASVFEVGVFDAKTHLSDILGKVAKGACFYITKHGQRIAEIKPVNEEKPKKRAGGDWVGRIWISPDFDAPLADFKDYMP